MAGHVVPERQHLKVSGRKEKKKKKKKDIIRTSCFNDSMWNMRVEQTGNRRGTLGWVTPGWMRVRNKDIRIFNQ